MSSLYDYDDPLRTNLSSLYRYRRDLGLYRVGYRGRKLQIRMPILPSTQRRVPSGHEGWPSILYLHGPSVWPILVDPDTEDPVIQDSLSVDSWLARRRNS